MTGRYILRDRAPVPCEDLFEWARWFEAADRVVAQDTVGAYFVSTVFLGLDHGFGRRTGRPILFETMIFRGTDAGRAALDYQERCATWDEAIAEHARAVVHAHRLAAAGASS